MDNCVDVEDSLLSPAFVHSFCSPDGRLRSSAPHTAGEKHGHGLRRSQARIQPRL